MNIIKKLGLRAAAAAAGVLLAGAAQAAPVTYYFAGNFSLIVGTQAAVLADQAFNGTLTYNPATAPSFSGGSNSLDYLLGAGAVTVSTLLGTGSSNGMGSIRQIWNASVGTTLGGGFIGDSLSVISSFTGNAGLSPFNRMGLTLTDADNDGDDPFGGNLSALPTNILLSELNGAEFRLSTSSSSAYGRLACLSTSSTACSGVTNPMPEPGSLALACVSLLGLFATSRRQSRNFSS